ncbi:hypothetical protein A2Z22_04915 [Candidatus Woesebacteria bacterium RBG_16_34_12]|uniref:Uncharacterized protein n=1 Tax=Candidatus Woesebacteria bacterium RBG_16_34_12 TaxID=1802480 RepID=A0A1F7XAF1_9BACT|nr:MAG: hypothetical protein A2Z22_04915 [Candidatus Woesebacteria bacterium RBG_16_34_12]
MQSSKLQLKDKIHEFLKPTILRIFISFISIIAVFFISFFCTPLHIDLAEGGGFESEGCGLFTRLYYSIDIFSIAPTFYLIIFAYIVLSLLYGIVIFFNKKKNYVKSKTKTIQ